MTTAINTSESVKVMISFDEIKRLRKALPTGSILKLAEAMDTSYQIISNEFNKVNITEMSPDHQSRLFSKEILVRSIALVQETGNTSFDHLLEAC